MLKITVRAKALIRVCILLFLCMPTALRAETLRVTYGQFHPYSFTDEAGNAAGFAIDILRSVMESSGHEAEFVPSINPSHTLQLLASGEADLTTFLAQTPERLERALTTVEIGSFEMVAFALRSNGFTRNEDLAGRRIGVVKGSASASAAKMIPFAEVVEFPETDDLIVPLLTGDIEGVVSAEAAFSSRLHQARVSDEVNALSPSLVSLPYGLLVSRLRPDLVPMLNEALEQSLTPSKLAALREKWVGREPYVYERPAFWIAAAVLVLFLVVTGVLIWRLSRYRREAARVLKANQANDLLIRALDQINGAIVIYDANMRAVHRNAGFAKAFPGLVPDVDAGASMGDLIGRSYNAGMVRLDTAEMTVDEFVTDVIDAAEQGRDNWRVVTANNGLVYEARDFRLGDHHYASIRVDVTAQAALQETIRVQAERLKHSNDQLETFAAIAAHDLRAPLGRIYSLVDFVAEDLEEAEIKMPEQVGQTIDLLRQEAEMMRELVEDLLLYASAGTQNGQPQMIDPCARIDKVVQLIKPPAGFTVRTPSAIPTAHVDPVAFEAVMRNLIGNAVKHHGGQVGQIDVSASEDDTFIYVHVADDGVGIAESDQDAIFEPFHRLSGNSPGSGLGLALIKKTVENWGGSISLQSVLGAGSTFSVAIPKAAPS